jgi:uncharacterized membrane protein YhhN
MKRPEIAILYFIIGIVQIVLQNYSAPFAGLIIKSLIIPVLMVFFLVNVKLNSNRLNMIMLQGLIFSWIGDTLLELHVTGDNLFVAGLLSFLSAHIMYLTAFIKTPGENYIRGSRIMILLPVILYGIILIMVMNSGLGEMRIPVIIYTIIILSMLSAAINRKEKVNRKSYLYVLTGAVLFVISDSSIAINKFTFPFKHAGIVIMATYITAQFLIVTGYIYQYTQPGNPEG